MHSPTFATAPTFDVTAWFAKNWFQALLAAAILAVAIAVICHLRYKPVTAGAMPYALDTWTGEFVQRFNFLP